MWLRWVRARYSDISQNDSEVLHNVGPGAKETAPELVEPEREREMIHLTLGEILNRYDASTEPFSEVQLADALRKATKLRRPATTEERQIMLAEEFAFAVTPNYPDAGSGWGTYYGPLMTCQRKDGGTLEWPSIHELSEETVSYWKRRVEESRHPLLKARYADLVWEVSKSVTGHPAEIRFAWETIESTVRAVSILAFKEPVQAIERLVRALSVALAIGNDQRTKLVRDAMIQYEDRIAKDDRPGLWGFCFDHLVENKKVPLEEEQRSKIIRDLEARLKRLSTPHGDGSPNPHAVEGAAMRLATYYSRMNDTPGVRRVLCMYRDAYVAVAKAASPLVAHLWLKNVFGVLLQHGLTEDALEVERLLRDYGQRSADEMGTVSAEVRIPNDEIDRFVRAMTEGSFRDSFVRIAEHFLPDPDETKGQVLEMAKKAPLQALISRTVVDADGRPIATIGAVSEDLDGRVVHQMGENISISSYFLRAVLRSLEDRGDLTVDSVTEVLSECPLFGTQGLALIRRGLQAYFEGDQLVAVHLLIPQIEAAVRSLLLAVGGRTYQLGRMGELRLRTLDAILRDPVVEEVLTERGCAYLRMLLTDPRGWNLRNNVMHGLLAADQFSHAMSDRLLHVLALLSLVRKEEQSEDVKAGPSR